MLLAAMEPRQLVHQWLQEEHASRLLPTFFEGRSCSRLAMIEEGAGKKDLPPFPRRLSFSSFSTAIGETLTAIAHSRHGYAESRAEHVKVHSSGAPDEVRKDRLKEQCHARRSSPSRMHTAAVQEIACQACFFAKAPFLGRSSAKPILVSRRELGLAAASVSLDAGPSDKACTRAGIIRGERRMSKSTRADYGECDKMDHRLPSQSSTPACHLLAGEESSTRHAYGTAALQSMSPMACSRLRFALSTSTSSSQGVAVSAAAVRSANSATRVICFSRSVT